MGCIQSGVEINIIRLTYRNGIATARLLESQEILALMRDPLLRLTNVLSGLFFEFIVVTESDSDRAFYQEVNERLLAFKPGWGIPNCLFLNAQNKQTVHRILLPLRNLGIPTATIVDIDVIKEGGVVWTSFLKGGCVPKLERKSLAVSRKNVKDNFDAIGKNMKTEGGIDILKEGDKESAENLFSRLEEYGLFVVKRGEAESWLAELDSSGHGSEWLIEIFRKMGHDPEDQNYLKPGEDDVWKFLQSIRRWLLSANRKGIPS